MMIRDFKGVWIPREIWLNQNISWMEKLFLTEINSLDNEQGCFASNDYFAEFFYLSRQRCSQIIGSLVKKGMLSRKYEREGKMVKRRVLNILDTGIKNINKGYQIYLPGYQENYQDNNTTNNTVNKKNVGRVFTPPSLQEVKEYLQYLKETRIDAQEFIDFYASKGWMVGKNKMVDWKAAVRTWIKRLPKQKKTAWDEVL